MADKQREGVAAVVENPDLPRMGEIEVAPRRIGRKIVMMPEKPRKYRGTRNLMDPVPSRRSVAKTAAELDDQEPRPTRKARAKESPIDKEGYVRLQIRVADGELSLAGASFVEGPLIQPELVHPGLSYEVKIGRRRIAVGDVPDPEEWRSYPDPLGRPGLDQHHVTKPDTYEFTARVPAAEVSDQSLEQTQVSLYRWTGAGPGEALSAAALTKQPKGAVARVGVLKGIDIGALPKAVQKDIRRASQ